MSQVLHVPRQRLTMSRRRSHPVEIGDYLRILRERWLLLLAVLVAVLAVTAAATLLRTPTYVATATLFVTVDSANDTAYELSQFSRQRVGSYAQVVDSPSVLVPVIEELALETGLAGLQARVDAVNPANTVLLEVSAQAGSGEEAARIANAAATHLARFIQQLESGSGPRAITSAPELVVPAVAPDRPDDPRPLISLGLGLIVGLSAGVLAALMRNRHSRRVVRSRSVGRDFGLDNVGSVPSLGGDRPGTEETARSSYRELAANLHLMHDGAVPPRILLLPVDAEAAAELDVRVLCQVLADLGHRVCYVEGDRSVPAAFPELASSAGLADVLTGRVPLPDAVQWVESVPMSVVGAGTPDGSPRPFDVAGRVGPLLQDLQTDHDIVIVGARFDEPPLDAALVAPISDCVLLVGRDAETTGPDLEDALDELSAVHVKPTGVILIGAPLDSDGTQE